jgi:hypothetical protein
MYLVKVVVVVVVVRRKKKGRKQAKVRQRRWRLRVSRKLVVRQERGRNVRVRVWGKNGQKTLPANWERRTGKSQ